MHCRWLSSLRGVQPLSWSIFLLSGRPIFLRNELLQGGSSLNVFDWTTIGGIISWSMESEPDPGHSSPLMIIIVLLFELALRWVMAALTFLSISHQNPWRRLRSKNGDMEDVLMITSTLIINELREKASLAGFIMSFTNPLLLTIVFLLYLVDASESAPQKQHAIELAEPGQEGSYEDLKQLEDGRTQGHSLPMTFAAFLPQAYSMRATGMAKSIIDTWASQRSVSEAHKSAVKECLQHTSPIIYRCLCCQ